MSDEQHRPALARFGTAVFHGIELFAYLAIGGLLSCAGAIALIGATIVMWQGLALGTDTAAVFSVVERLLFVLLLVEILHTITASVRSGSLTCEPFLAVGLIACIRRVLVITLQTSQEAKESGGQAHASLQDSMLELAVLGALILVIVVSLYLLRRAQSVADRSVTASPQAPETRPAG